MTLAEMAREYRLQEDRYRRRILLLKKEKRSLRRDTACCVRQDAVRSRTVSDKYALRLGASGMDTALKDTH